MKVYVYASERSERARKFWHFYILKVLFLSIFCRYKLYACRLTCMNIYRPNSEKALLGGGGGGGGGHPPAPPPLSGYASGLVNLTTYLSGLSYIPIETNKQINKSITSMFFIILLDTLSSLETKMYVFQKFQVFFFTYKNLGLHVYSFLHKPPKPSMNVKRREISSHLALHG